MNLLCIYFMMTKCRNYSKRAFDILLLFHIIKCFSIRKDCTLETFLLLYSVRVWQNLSKIGNSINKEMNFRRTARSVAKIKRPIQMIEKAYIPYVNYLLLMKWTNVRPWFCIAHYVFDELKNKCDQLPIFILHLAILPNF